MIFSIVGGIFMVHTITSIYATYYMVDTSSWLGGGGGTPLLVITSYILLISCLFQTARCNYIPTII